MIFSGPGFDSLRLHIFLLGTGSIKQKKLINDQLFLFVDVSINFNYFFFLAAFLATFFLATFFLAAFFAFFAIAFLILVKHSFKTHLRYY